MRKTLVLCCNQQGAVLSQISNLLASRQVNLLSLCCGGTDKPLISRITVVIEGGNHLADQLATCFSGFVDVISVAVLDRDAMISSELMMVKVKATVKTRQEILTICQLCQGTVVDISPQYLCLQCVGTSEFLDRFLAMLCPYELIDVLRSGQIALEKEEK